MSTAWPCHAGGLNGFRNPSVSRIPVQQHAPERCAFVLRLVEVGRLLAGQLVEVVAIADLVALIVEVPRMRRSSTSRSRRSSGRSLFCWRVASSPSNRQIKAVGNHSARVVSPRLRHGQIHVGVPCASVPGGHLHHKLVEAWCERSGPTRRLHFEVKHCAECRGGNGRPGCNMWSRSQYFVTVRGIRSR